jgi:hypothetical protein
MRKTNEREGRVTITPEFEKTDIFKYGLAKDLKRTLENCTIGFSFLNKFNDPFEESYEHIHRFKSIDDRNVFYTELMEGLEWNFINKIKELIKVELEKKVVTCFSKTPYEPLMWAHYSEKHQGICYCFDKNDIFLNKLTYRFSDIRYSNMLPKLNFFDGLTNIELLKPQIEEIVLTKSDNWAYEKEFRFYTESDSTVHNFNPKSLLGVVLGTRITNSEEEEIKNLVSDYNTKHKLDVKIMYATPSNTNYKMKIAYHRINNSSIKTPLYVPDSLTIEK